MLAVNLKNDLTKLPIQERLNLMMHYRACEVLNQQSPITESEYWAIDGSIKSGEEIRAYNRANRAFIELVYLTNNLQKIYLMICLEVSYLQKIKLLNFQTENITDGINFFLHCLDDIIKITKPQKDAVTEKLAKCINSNGVLFHKLVTENEKTEEGEIVKYIIPQLDFREGEKVAYLSAFNRYNEYKKTFDDFIAEYNKREAESGIIIKPFIELIGDITEDVTGKQKLVDSKFFLTDLEEQ